MSFKAGSLMKGFWKIRDSLGFRVQGQGMYRVSMAKVTGLRGSGVCDFRGCRGLGFRVQGLECLGLQGFGGWGVWSLRVPEKEFLAEA